MNIQDTIDLIKNVETLKKDVIWAVFGNDKPTTILTSRQLEKLKVEIKYHRFASTFEKFSFGGSSRTEYTFNKEKYDYYLEIIMADYTAVQS